MKYRTWIRGLLVTLVFAILFSGTACRPAALPAKQLPLLIPGLTLPPGAQVTYQADGEWEATGTSALYTSGLDIQMTGKFYMSSIEFTSSQEWETVLSHIDACLTGAGFADNSAQLSGSPDAANSAWMQKYKYYEQAGTKNKVNFNELTEPMIAPPAAGQHIYALHIAVEKP